MRSIPRARGIDATNGYGRGDGHKKHQPSPSAMAGTELDRFYRRERKEREIGRSLIAYRLSPTAYRRKLSRSAQRPNPRDTEEFLGELCATSVISVPKVFRISAHKCSSVVKSDRRSGLGARSILPQRTQKTQRSEMRRSVGLSYEFFAIFVVKSDWRSGTKPISDFCAFCASCGPIELGEFPSRSCIAHR